MWRARPALSSLPTLYFHSVPLSNRACVSRFFVSSSSPSPSSRAEHLRSTLLSSSFSYYNKGESNVSDQQYDEMLRELSGIERKYPHLIVSTSPTQTVGAPPSLSLPPSPSLSSSSLAKTLHPIPMLSLDSVNTAEDIEEWLKKTSVSLETKRKELALVEGEGEGEGGKQPLTFVLEPKYDGFAVELYYLNGKLVSCSTRGNGREGENITENTKQLVREGKRIRENIDLSSVREQAQLREILIRGEVILSKEEYNTYKQHLMNNDEGEEEGEGQRTLASNTARNLAVGLLRRDLNRLSPSHISSLPKLSFRPYSLHILNRIEGNKGSREEGEERGENISIYSTHIGRMELLEQWGFDISPITSFSFPSTPSSCFSSSFSPWLSPTARSLFPYEIDGLVIKMNDLSSQSLLGSSARSPRYCVSYKFPSVSAVGEIKGIEWNVGKSGKLAPVALVHPVLCGGIVIERISIHNVERMKELALRVGSKVVIKRANDVIPSITERVVEEEEPSLPSSSPLLPPVHCPFCSSPLSTQSSLSDLFCTNISSCEGILLSHLLYYSSKDAMNIDTYGGSVRDILYSNRIINKLIDFIILAENKEKQREFREKLIQINGFKKSKIDKLLLNIINSHLLAKDKNILTALSIPLIGKENVNQLIKWGKARNINNLIELVEEVHKWDIEQLGGKKKKNKNKHIAEDDNVISISGFGKERLISLQRGLREEEKREIINKIINFQKQHKENIDQPIGFGEKGKETNGQINNNILKGEYIVITGTHSVPRSSLSSFLEERAGAVVQNSITKATTILLVDSKQAEEIERWNKGEGEKKLNKKLLEAIERSGKLRILTEDTIRNTIEGEDRERGVSGD